VGSKAEGERGERKGSEGAGIERANRIKKEIMLMRG